jgi:hypothetical protein
MHQATADVKCQLKGQRGAKEETDKRTNSGIPFCSVTKAKKESKKRDIEEKKKKIRSSNKRWLASGEQQNSLSLNRESFSRMHACI